MFTGERKAECLRVREKQRFVYIGLMLSQMVAQHKTNMYTLIMIYKVIQVHALNIQLFEQF